MLDVPLEQGVATHRPGQAEHPYHAHPYRKKVSIVAAPHQWIQVDKKPAQQKGIQEQSGSGRDWG
jgi:hypothetical protein